VQNSPPRFQAPQTRKLPASILGARLRYELAAEYPLLARYMSETRFNGAVQDFLQKVQSPLGLGTLAKTFPDYLAIKFQAFLEIGELAVLERSFHNAERVEAPSVSFSSASNDRRHKTFQIHSSAQLLLFTQNTTGIWSCLVCKEPPPRPYVLDKPQRVVVWRQNQCARFRILGDEEARDLTGFKRRPLETSPYFLGWLETGLAVAWAK
jgi:hypothetical protein